MTIRFESGLPYVTVTVHNGNDTLKLDHVVLDTGASVSIFDSDRLEQIGIYVEPDDPIHEVRGIGGVELAITKCLEKIEVGDLILHNFCVDMGPMDYGFPIDGLLGSDFLAQIGAVINFDELRLYRS